MKVVSAQEMIRIEQKAIQKGADAEGFMRAVGKKGAQAILSFLKKHHLLERVDLLVGKGNNGGDAFAIGIELLKAGVQVKAWAFYPAEKRSELNRKLGQEFEETGGQFASLQEKVSFAEASLLVDGLLGTGFQGSVEPFMGHLILKANDSGKPIFAIDLPSGLNATTGEVGSYVIHAFETIALGLPKLGFFLREGWNVVGRIRMVDFGLSEEAQEEAKPFAWIPSGSHFSLPSVVRNRHKYEAGYVVGLSGSSLFPGAPQLAGLAALRAGAGIVRIFHADDRIEGPPELILQPWKEALWKEELQRAKALFIGPGLNPSFQKKLPALLKQIQLPCVLDAEALIPEISSFPKETILTPHRKEALRLFQLKAETSPEELIEKAKQFSEQKQVVIVLKGAPTWVFAPGKLPAIIPRGTPAMAKAGTGDVLTGVLAALLAQGMKGEEAALLGVTLHALAGEEAARDKTVYGVIASDLIKRLPSAFRMLGATG